MKKLEKAATKWVFVINSHRWSNNNDECGDNYGSFKAGAEWQAKQMHSEEEVIKFTTWFTEHCVYYDGWNIRVPLGDKYPEVYTIKEIFKIYKKEKSDES
jgi:hypothetical protein